MQNPQNFLIGGNDEHGLTPPTAGKRTPVMPYIGRPFYENEFTYPAKNFFLEACLRTGFNVFDVKRTRVDVPISQRVALVNRQNLTLVVTFGYNAFGDGNSFNSVSGINVFYSQQNVLPQRSRILSTEVYNQLIQGTPQRGRGVATLTGVGMLSSVNTVATLPEPGFMTNFGEAKIMVDPDFQRECGEETCRGVCSYLDVAYVARIAPQNLPVLRQGSRGNFVKYLQYLLYDAGYDPQSADGVFGALTRNAVIGFQRENGLSQDGIVGANTWSKLLNENPQNTVLRQGSRGVEVRYLQRKLLAKLYNVGVIDNIFGAQTARAVREFQQENGLAVDAIVGRQTWNRIMPIGGGRPLP